GLYVVARLAQRGGFAVQLAQRAGAAGTVAEVMVPPALVVGSSDLHVEPLRTPAPAPQADLSPARGLRLPSRPPRSVPGRAPERRWPVAPSPAATFRSHRPDRPRSPRRPSRRRRSRPQDRTARRPPTAEPVAGSGCLGVPSPRERPLPAVEPGPAALRRRPLPPRRRPPGLPGPADRP